MTWAREGQYGRALGHLKEAVRLDPRHYWSWLQKGICHLELGEPEGVVPVGLAAMAPGVHPHPGGQLRGHVQHLLAIGHQPLRQGPARPAAALNRPAALLPPSRERCQPPVALLAMGEPGRLDHRLRHRVQHRRGVARLMRNDRDHHIAIHELLLADQGHLARRAMQLPAEQTSLEPLPRRAGKGRAAGRS